MAWTEVESASQPAARYGHSMAFIAGQSAVMFGGDDGGAASVAGGSYEAGSFRDDFWKFDAVRGWSKIGPSESQARRLDQQAPAAPRNEAETHTNSAAAKPVVDALAPAPSYELPRPRRLEGGNDQMQPPSTDSHNDPNWMPENTEAASISPDVAQPDTGNPYANETGPPPAPSGSPSAVPEGELEPSASASPPVPDDSGNQMPSPPPTVTPDTSGEPHSDDQPSPTAVPTENPMADDYADGNFTDTTDGAPDDTPPDPNEAPADDAAANAGDDLPGGDKASTATWPAARSLHAWAPVTSFEGEADMVDEDVAVAVSTKFMLMFGGQGSEEIGGGNGRRATAKRIFSTDDLYLMVPTDSEADDWQYVKVGRTNNTHGAPSSNRLAPEMDRTWPPPRHAHSASYVAMDSLSACGASQSDSDCLGLVRDRWAQDNGWNVGAFFVFGGTTLDCDAVHEDLVEEASRLARQQHPTSSEIDIDVTPTLHVYRAPGDGARVVCTRSDLWRLDVAWRTKEQPATARRNLADPTQSAAPPPPMDAPDLSPLPEEPDAIGDNLANRDLDTITVGNLQVRLGEWVALRPRSEMTMITNWHHVEAGSVGAGDVDDDEVVAESGPWSITKALTQWLGVTDFDPWPAPRAHTAMAVVGRSLLLHGGAQCTSKCTFRDDTWSFTPNFDFLDASVPAGKGWTRTFPVLDAHLERQDDIDEQRQAHLDGKSGGPGRRLAARPNARPAPPGAAAPRHLQGGAIEKRANILPMSPTRRYRHTLTSTSPLHNAHFGEGPDASSLLPVHARRILWGHSDLALLFGGETYDPQYLYLNDLWIYAPSGELRKCQNRIVSQGKSMEELMPVPDPDPEYDDPEPPEPSPTPSPSPGFVEEADDWLDWLPDLLDLGEEDAPANAAGRRRRRLAVAASGMSAPVVPTLGRHRHRPSGLAAIAHRLGRLLQEAERPPPPLHFDVSDQFATAGDGGLWLRVPGNRDGDNDIARLARPASNFAHLGMYDAIDEQAEPSPLPELNVEQADRVAPIDLNNPPMAAVRTLLWGEAANPHRGSFLDHQTEAVMVEARLAFRWFAGAIEYVGNPDGSENSWYNMMFGGAGDGPRQRVGGRGGFGVDAASDGYFWGISSTLAAIILCCGFCCTYSYRAWRNRRSRSNGLPVASPDSSARGGGSFRDASTPRRRTWLSFFTGPKKDE